MYGGHQQFDGNAAFAGGGFMPSQATQTATDPSFSPAKNRDAQTLIPLTVKQITEAFHTSDDKMNLLVDGVDVNNVKLVGMLWNKAERVTDIQFVIDDGTGRVDCQRWVHEAVDTKEMEKVVDGMYVVVHGHLKALQGKKQMMVYSIRPVTDFNEITNHFAECIYVHCYNTKFKKFQDNASSSSVHIPNTGLNTPVKGYQHNTPSQIPGQFPGQNNHDPDGMVLNYLQQPTCLELLKGVHIDELSRNLGLPMLKIRAAIQTLENEGLVYSTVDESHYKSTANG